MPRPIVVEILPDAIRRNLRYSAQLAPGAKVWAVVKANAYGHGIERIFPALADADGIALLDLNEAIRIRELGWKKPVLLLEGFFEPRDIELVDRHQLTVAIQCEEQLQLLAAASDMTRPVDIQLKMNSGMNRLGFRPEAYLAAWKRASSMIEVGHIGLMSHFANADNHDIEWQMRAFDSATVSIPGERTLANSAAVLWHPAAHRDWIRPGIVLYGASPSGKANDIAGSPLRASMRLLSKLIGIQELKRGETIGYGRHFKAGSDMRIGVVACGYADGYPRHAPTGTPIMVDGVLTHTVGRVSMDMLTIDLTPCPAAQIGSTVELWGDRIKIDDVAAAAGTIGYELMCAVAPRVPVRVIQD